MTVEEIVQPAKRSKQSECETVPVNTNHVSEGLAKGVHIYFVY